MKDIFNSYHKQKALSHLWILAVSWVLAVSINMFMLGGPTGDTLKANINELQSQNIMEEDISISELNNSISIRNNQQMDGVQQFSISFAYDDELLIIGDSISLVDGINVSKIESTPWFSSFILVLDSATDFSENTEILKLSYTKKQEQTIYLNPVNINFLDSEENNYSLTASSLLF